MEKYSLLAEQLSIQLTDSELPFGSLDEVESCVDFLGQDRAKKALSFGLESTRSGYNLFVMGNSGTGRISLVMKYLEEKAKNRPAQSDWVYVNNFEEPREPEAICLPAGSAKQLTGDCKKMITRWLVTLPTAFENPSYLRRKTAIEKKFNQQFDSAIEVVENEANQRKFALYQDAANISFSPIIDGKPVDDITFAGLEQTQRDEINQTITELEDKLNEALLEMPQWKRESYDALQELNSQTIHNAVDSQVAELEEKHEKVEGIQTYFKELREHLVKLVLENFPLIESPEFSNNNQLRELLQQSFIPNQLVNNEPSQGAPVVYEPHPTFANLFGRVEYWNENGAIATNYQHIQNGAFHRANGGYLVLEVEKVLEDPYIWNQVKRTLQTEELKLEPPMAEGQTAVTIGMSPQAVPLNLKIILVGSREYYYLLQDNDPEFGELFRILVDFDEQVDRTTDAIRHLACLIKTRCGSENFAPVTNQAFVELIKFSARLSGHQNQLSTQLGEVFELMGEADVIRSIQQEPEIDAHHVIDALQEREFRHSRIRNEMLREVVDGQIIINTDGFEIGGVNGLTVWEIGSTDFGTPARITATVVPGSKGIVDIERESDLGLSIHSKGVLILSGYIAHRYATEFPLTISANIVMEQSYGFIDGDSASLAELVALISAISKIPVNQSLAVTGSINQFGEVQAIGGANEKIEGFFGICKARGLTGTQGVIIPKANQPHLMLKQSVIDAVKQGLFNIYVVDTVDQAIQILCNQSDQQLEKMHQDLTDKLKDLHDMCEDSGEEESGEEEIKAVEQQLQSKPEPKLPLSSPDEDSIKQEPALADNRSSHDSSAGKSAIEGE